MFRSPPVGRIERLEESARESARSSLAAQSAPTRVVGRVSPTYLGADGPSQQTAMQPDTRSRTRLMPDTLLPVRLPDGGIAANWSLAKVRNQLELLVGWCSCTTVAGRSGGLAAAQGTNPGLHFPFRHGIGIPSTTCREWRWGGKESNSTLQQGQAAIVSYMILN